MPEAFRAMPNLVSVVADSVTSLGYSVFSSFSLETVVMSKNIRLLAIVFSARSLVSITIPDGVSVVARDSFIDVLHCTL